MSSKLIDAKSLLRMLKEYTTDASDAVRGLANQYAKHENTEVTCKHGCSACCYQKILVTAGEGLAIYMLLREQGRWNDEMKAMLLLEDRKMTDYDHFTWFGLRRPCVFLKKTAVAYEECSVYAVRPPGCAATFSIKGDPGLCAVPGGHGQVQVNGIVTPELQSLMGLLIGLGHSIDPGAGLVMTLPGAVLWAAAAVEKKPLPDVHRVPMSIGSGDDFDRVASHKEKP